jgi:hypothetical protein
MTESTERTLAQFLRNHDVRELTYTDRGRLVVESIGDGTSTVIVISSALRGESGPTWDCASPLDLFSALRAGMKELCDAPDVDATVDAFVFFLSQKRND